MPEDTALPIIFRHWMVCLFILLTLLGEAAAQAPDPTEESLLAAWEEIQHSDPKTVQFERIEPNLYRFETRRFPFDGKLRVLNLSVDSFPGGGLAGGSMGTVEVDLLDTAPDFFARHARSYGLWARNNNLYYDPEIPGWIDAETWQQRIMEPSLESVGWAAWLVSWSHAFWLLLLLGILVFLTFISRKANRQINASMAAQEKIMAEHERILRLSERMLTIAEDSNQVLKEIRDLFRNSR
jgi:hypothetical protein